MADIINFKTRKHRLQIKQKLSALLTRLFSIRYKKMIAYGRRSIRWVDHNNEIEELDFYLFVDIFGRRSYKIHSYGYAEALKKHDLFLGDINIWKNGGPIPVWCYATTTQTTYTDRLTATKPEAPKKEQPKKPELKILHFPKKPSNEE